MTTMIFTAAMICTMDIIDCIDDDYIDGINDIKVIYNIDNDNEIDNDDINIRFMFITTMM